MDNSDTLSLASTPTAYSTQRLIQVIMSEEKEDVARDIGSEGGDSDIEDLNSTIDVIKSPKVGGIIKGVVWTGGPRTKRNKKPASPYAYRPVGFSAVPSHLGTSTMAPGISHTHSTFLVRNSRKD